MNFKNFAYATCAALLLATASAAQPITTTQHKYYVFSNKVTGITFVNLSYMLNDDGGRRQLIRMADENDVEFADPIARIKSCFNRTLGVLNDPTSALIDLLAFPASDKSSGGTATGSVRAKNAFGGMVRKGVLCDFKGVPVSIF